MAGNSISRLGLLVKPDPNQVFEDWVESDLAQRLLLVFDHLEDQPLLQALEETRWTGRPGHPIPVMWRIMIARYVLNLDSFAALLRALGNNPLLAHLCGIGGPCDIPKKMVLSRFLSKLVDHRHLIEECSARITRELTKTLPGFGEIVAIDSSHISAFSNGSKPNPSDSDASCSAKGGRNGDREWWFGHKISVVADATHEIPIVIETTTAKVHDSRLMVPLLEKARTVLRTSSPRYILADAGYDTKAIYRAIVEDFGAVPIIKLNTHGKRLDEPYGELTDYQGTPYGACGEPMIFWGHDKQRGIIKYRCPIVAHTDSCPEAFPCTTSPYGPVIRLKISDDYRRYCQVPRGTKRWTKLYNMRASVERIFGRLKEYRKLDKITVRGKEKVELHCVLATVTMQAMALGKAEQEALSEIRNNVRKVA